MNDLEKFQTKAAQIVTAPSKLVFLNSLLPETRWETLASRRKKHKLSLFYKLYNDLSSKYLSPLVPASVGSALFYPLRNGTDINTIHINCQLYHNPFLPSAFRDLNYLPDETRNSPTVCSFGKSLMLVSLWHLVITSLIIFRFTKLDSEPHAVH